MIVAYNKNQKAFIIFRFLSRALLVDPVFEDERERLELRLELLELELPLELRLKFPMELRIFLDSLEFRESLSWFEPL